MKVLVSSIRKKIEKGFQILLTFVTFDFLLKHFIHQNTMNNNILFHYLMFNSTPEPVVILLVRNPDIELVTVRDD